MSKWLCEKESLDLQRLFYDNRLQSLSIALARLHLTDRRSDHREWHRSITGLICVIKDYNRRSYFISLIKINDDDQENMVTLVWEQELYLEMHYRQRESSFHTFESDKCVCGIEFANNEEAVQWASTIQFRLNRLREKSDREGMQAQGSQQHGRHARRAIKDTRSIQNRSIGRGIGRGSSSAMDLGIQDRLLAYQSRLFKLARSGSSGLLLSRKMGEGDNGSRVTKSSISQPTNFVHVSGIKTSEKGFQQVDHFDEVDPRVRDFLTVAGLNDRILEDPEAKREIDAFVNDNSVGDHIDKFKHKHDVNGNSNEKVEVINKPSLTARTTTKTEPSPPPPPPPPPPQQPPSLPSTQSTPVKTTTTTSSSSSSSSSSSGRADLMAEIRRRAGQPRVGGSGRGTETSSPISSDPQSTLTGVMREALQAIQQANMSSDEDDKDDPNESDAWSDD